MIDNALSTKKNVSRYLYFKNNIHNYYMRHYLNTY